MPPRKMHVRGVCRRVGAGEMQYGIVVLHLPRPFSPPFVHQTALDGEQLMRRKAELTVYTSLILELSFLLLTLSKSLGRFVDPVVLFVTSLCKGSI